MRAVGLFEFGPPEVLRPVELMEQHAGRGKVRIRVTGAGVNPADTFLRSGSQAALVRSWPRPIVPGMEVAGVVDEVGEGVAPNLTPGTRVMAALLPIRMHVGGYSEHLVLPAQHVVATPSRLDDPHAAALPMTGLTALRGVDLIAAPAGSTILVTGAVGIVGGYVVQLAKHLGWHVIADAAPADVAAVEELGADEIVHRGDGAAVARQVRRNRSDGVDAVADVAGLGCPIAASLRDGGVYASFSGGGSGSMLGSGARRVDFVAPSVTDAVGSVEALSRLHDLAARGVLVPRVADAIPAHYAAQAHRLVERGGVRGRLVLEW